MGKHRVPEPTPEDWVPPPEPVMDATPARPEPVAIAAAVQAVLAALVTLGWVQLDDTTIATIGTIVASAIALVITMVARSKVTPVSDPKFDGGHQ